MVWETIKNWGRMIWYGDEFLRALEVHNQNLLNEAAEHALAVTRQNLSTIGRSAPGDYPGMSTGKLRDSVYARVDPGTKTVRVGTDLRYGYYLEYGTAGGRIIRAAPGSVLVWRDPHTGELVHAKWVIQGAVAPRPWMRRSVEELKPWLDRHFRKPLVWKSPLG